MTRGVCDACAGIGWLNHGWCEPESVGGETCDVAIADWRKCETCGGSGVYVSLSEAGGHSIVPTDTLAKDTSQR